MVFKTFRPFFPTIEKTASFYAPYLAKKFQFYKKHSLELSVDIFNVLNMLNKDWGAGHNLGAQKIYTIKSFDKEKKEYVYNVNANTGVSSLNGTPYQVQIGLRYAF